MSVIQETTIRVPVALRDLIRDEAGARGLRQADLLRLALKELEQAEFLRSVAATTWDNAPENHDWDDADLVSGLDPWETPR